MNDFREITREQKMLFLQCEIDMRFDLYKTALGYHDEFLQYEEEQILRELPRIAYGLGAITDLEKEELVKLINEKMKKIKEEIKYGCM